MSNLSPAAVLYDSSGTEKGTTTNPVQVSAVTKTSTLNTSTTPLLANATFTGAWEDTTPYGFMTVDAFADAASAVGGWLMQWSFDGVNLDTSESFSLLASSGRSLAMPVRSKYFRMVYTNGATPQTAFRLNVLYRENGAPSNTHAVNWPVQDTSLALLTRSVIVGQTTAGGGSYVNVKVTPSGALTTETDLTTIGGAAISAANPLYVGPATGAAFPVTDNGGSLTVDGTVAATQSGNWSVRNLDGAGNALVSSTTAPAGTEQALIVRNIPSGTQTVSGTVTANAGTGTFAVSAASLPLPTGAATETTLGTRLADATFTGRFAATATLADSTANPSLTRISAFGMVYNGTTWDRLRGSSALGVSMNLTNVGGTAVTLGQKVSASSIPVVVASDQSALTVVQATASNLNATVTGTVTANAGTGTFAVSAASLPLPTGAATSALQTTGNTSLSSIDGKIPALGQALKAASLPVVLASDQDALAVSDNGGSLTVDGTVTANAGTGTFAVSAASLPLPTGAATETTLAAINTKTPPLGQTTAANSVPVVLASDTTLNASTTALVAIQEPNYTVGTTQPLSMYPDGYMRARVEMHSEITDAFGRLRVSNPTTLFDGKPLYGDRTSEFVEALTGAATSTLAANAPVKTLAVGSGATGSVIRQTRFYFDYQAGKSQQVLTTFSMSASPVAGTGYHRVGYFDDNNGLFLEKNADVLYVVRRSSTSGTPVDTAVAQSSWNIDPLDGTGPSGRTLNKLQSQILLIDFEWLGVGTARLGFVIDGDICYAHAFNWANTNTSVYMATPSLPVRWEINKTSLAGQASMEAICCSVTSEGGNPRTGFDTALDRGATVLAYTVGDGTNLKPLISVRTKTAYTRMTAFPVDVRAICTTSSSSGYRWVLLLNPTITGGTAASWTSAGTDSGLEYDIARTGVVTGGTPVASGYGVSNLVVGLGGNLRQLGATVAGTRDEYVLALQQFVAAGESYTGGITVREIY